MTTSYGGPIVWGLILLIGLLTFLIRLSFIGLFGYLDEIPPRVKHGLRFVPAAVLAALVVPSFISLAPASGGVAVEKLAAGLVAGTVAWRTEDVFKTIAAGMGSLWVARFLLLPAL
jgi:branched-subunit amino acid transport protein